MHCIPFDAVHQGVYLNCTGEITGYGQPITIRQYSYAVVSKLIVIAAPL